MTLNECKVQAETLMYEGHNDITFDIGLLKCRWLDPYLGFFQIDGKDGFLRADDFSANNFDCRNLSGKIK